MFGRDCILAHEDIVAVNKVYSTFFKERHQEFSTHLDNLNALIEKLNVI
jgi:hypothetical protein